MACVLAGRFALATLVPWWEQAAWLIKGPPGEQEGGGGGSRGAGGQGGIVQATSACRAGQARSQRGEGGVEGEGVAQLAAQGAGQLGAV